MRSALAILLIVILVPLFIVVLLGHAVNGTVLNPEFLKRTLAKERVYELALAEAQKRLATATMPFDHPFLKSEDLLDLLPRVVTAAWLRQTVEGVIGGAYGWLAAAPGAAPPRLIIDLREPKSRLITELTNVLERRAAELPLCPGREPPEGKLCRPVGLTDEQEQRYLEQLRASVSDFFAQISDTADLSAPGGLEAALGGHPQTSSPAEPELNQQPPRDAGLEPEKIKTAYQFFRQGLTVATGVGIGLVGVYLLLVLRGWRRTSRWVGVLSLCLGVLPLAFGYASNPLVRQMLLPKIHFPSDFASLAPLAVRLILDVRQAVFQPLLVWGLALVLVGVAGIVASFFLPKRQSKPKQA